MKQYITAKQLNELSEKEIEALRKWLTKKQYGEYRSRHMGEKGYFNPEFLLSIGQMIEFLGKHGFNYLTLSHEKHKKKEWFVNIPKTGFVYVDNELIDALWEATKEVLEK